MASQRGAVHFATVKGRQGAYITALIGGASRKDALTQVGLVSMQTVYRWRKDYPAFAEQERAVTIGRITASNPRRVNPVSDAPIDQMATDYFAHWRESMFGFETYFHQRRICDELHAAMQRRDTGLVLILVPPDHGKTTLLNDWACKRLSVEANLRMVIVQESADQAKRFLGRIKQRMTTNRRFIEDHGRPFYMAGQEKQGKVWSSHAIKLYDFDADEQDYSLEALGWTSQVSGHRVDAMIIDDVQSKRSMNQTRKMVDVLRQDFLSRLTAEAMCAIIATRVGVGDVYDVLLKEDLIDHLVVLPAHNGTVTECEFGAECTAQNFVHYEPLAPEMITPHRLAIKHKQAGRSAWANTWMQSPETDGTATFPARLVDGAYDNDLDVGQVRPGGGCIMSLDPAIVGNCVLTIFGYYPNRLDVIDQVIRSDLGSTEGIFQMIENGALRYHPQTLVIETNSWQRLFAEDVRLREMGRAYGFRIEPNDTTKYKNDEVLGVATMANSLGRHEMFFAGTELARRVFELLDHELKSWRPYARNDVIAQDTVMSTWFGHRYWLENRMRAETQSNFRGRALPWNPTGTGPVRSSEAMQFERHIAQEREREAALVTR